jgi:SAM-dependent methyltransferase
MQNVARYDAIAEWYDGFIGETGGPRFEKIEWPCLQEILGNLRGKTVLDLACGQGFLSRILARFGARLVGIDLSSELIARATTRERAEPLGIVYFRDDAQRLASQADDTFDLVVCRYALMDIPDLDAVYRGVRRVLRDQGRFVALITHPCFYTPRAHAARNDDGAFHHWESDGYFDEGEWWSDNRDGVRGQVGAIHRTFATYVNAGLAAGLVLDGLYEPRPADDVDDVALAMYRQIPWTLVFTWQKVLPRNPSARP